MARPMIREVRLELLRHGPPHNQLLSPLTQYLALCGNHSAQTVQLPIEHADYLRRLRGLRYRTSEQQVTSESIDAMSRDVTRVLASIPALPADLTSVGDAREIIHLKLVLSASELAMLPFELATSSAGLPGEGQALLLQDARPVVLTREARRVAIGQVQWPSNPKVLVVLASPENYPPVPADAHVLALRRAVDPWLGWLRLDEGLREFKQHVTILPRATIDAVYKACMEADYTHVHVLAHGVAKEVGVGGEERFTLAFHSSRKGAAVDYVSGARLAAALCTRGSAGHRPTVTTVAACEGASEGGVIVPGGSVAHELHEAGVPFVVASQFPLSYAGSVIMADVLYRQFFRGDDPRLALDLLRRELFTRVPDRHDWASIVAYAAFPPDIDAQVEEVRYQRTRKAIDVSLARLTWTEGDTPENATALQQLVGEFEGSLAALDDGRRSQMHGFLASVGSRVAHLRSRPGRDLTDGVRGEAGGLQSTPVATMSHREALLYARNHYHRAFVLDPAKVWALSQRIILDFVLSDCARFSERDWNVAWTLAHEALASSAESRVISTHGTLIELNLLRRALATPVDEEAAVNAALEHFQELVSRAGIRSFHAFSAIRQVVRLRDWWAAKHPAVCGAATRLYDHVRDWRIPEKWNER